MANKEKLGPVDVNFLFSYYDQDGDHSAVTGGRGTEKLEDYASKIIINVPLDRTSELNVSSHINYYSSASSDNINSRVSSASSGDIRTQVSTEYTKKNIEKGSSYSFLTGGSVESDYISFSIGGGWRKASPDANREFGITGRAFFDTWHLFFPDELRGTAHKDVNTDKRRSFSLSFNYSQILTKRLQASVNTSMIYQQGLLSTPFHRVYFSDTTVAKIERLPESRIKFPVGLRMNYYIGNHLITRLSYRFYIDNFGILANTFSFEFPIKIGKTFSVSPFYRFHIQTKSDYFSGYGLHQSDDLYYTSDFDLSSFQHHKIGAGFSYTRAAGLKKLNEKEKRFGLNAIGIRYARYFRSDGLTAFLISLHVGLEM